MQSIAKGQDRFGLDWVRLQQAAQYHQRLESTQRPALVIPCYLLKGAIK